MNRRFLVVLVVCLALIGLMVSCKNDIEINEEFGQELVSVTFAKASGASRGLSASLEDFEHNIENYYWGYAAKKSAKDKSEMRRGETPNYATSVVWLNVQNSEPAPGLPTNPIPGFSQGYWDFRLCAYKKVVGDNPSTTEVETDYVSYVLVYQGETKEFLLKSSSTNESGNNLVTVTVNPVSTSGNGTLIIKTTGTDAIKLNKVDEASEYGTNYFPRVISVASMADFHVEYVDTDAEKTKATCGADGVFSLPAGTYKITFAFADSATAPTVNYAKGTIVATVYSNLDTTIKGDLSEMTTSVTIQPELNPELVTYTAVSGYIEKTDSTTTVTFSSSGVARKVEAKTTAAVTNTIIDDMATTSGTTSGYDQKLKLNLNVETVEATEVSATYEIGMTATLTSTSTTVPSDVKTSTSDVSSVAKYVTVTLGIQEGLTEVQAYHDGIAMNNLDGFELGEGWTVSPSVVDDVVVVKKVKSGESDVDITSILDDVLKPLDTHNKGFFFYDSTGVVVFITKSFSPYSLSFVKPLPTAFVAEVGGFKYTKLETAIKKAVTSSKVTLLKDIELESDVDFNVQGGILDLAGYTITGNVTASEYGATVKNGSIAGILTAGGNSALIKDLTVAGKISIGGTGAELENCTVTANGDYAVAVTAGNATIKSGTYKASATGKILNGSILVEDGNYKGTLTESASVCLKGGVYEHDVDTYAAEGYKCEKISENIYIVRKDVEAVNRTTEVEYYYLQDAINAASSDDVIGIMVDIETNGSIIIPEGKSITIELTDVIGELEVNRTITSKAAKVIVNNGSLTLQGKGSVLGIEAGNILFNNGTGATLVIKGGTYSSDPDKFVSEGLYGHKNENGTWTVTAIPEGKKVRNGNNFYDSLTAAVTACSEGDNIQLLDDITDSVSIKTSNLTIDLNGHKITATKTQSWWSSKWNPVFTVSQCENVTIKNGKVESGGNVFKIGDHQSTKVKYKTDGSYMSGYHPLAPAKNVVLENIFAEATGSDSLFYFTNIEDDLTRADKSNPTDNYLYGRYIYKTGYTSKEQYQKSESERYAEVFDTCDDKDSVTIIGGYYTASSMFGHMCRYTEMGDYTGAIYTEVVNPRSGYFSNDEIGRFLETDRYLIGNASDVFVVERSYSEEYTARVNNNYYYYEGGADDAISFAMLGYINDKGIDEGGGDTVYIRENATREKVFERGNYLTVVYDGGIVAESALCPRFPQHYYIKDESVGSIHTFYNKYSTVVAEVYKTTDNRNAPVESDENKIGEYPSVAEAFKAANKNGQNSMVKLVADYEGGDDAKYYYTDTARNAGAHTGSSVRFDLNGHTWTYTGTGSALVSTTTSGSSQKETVILDNSTDKKGGIYAPNGTCFFKENSSTEHTSIRSGKYTSKNETINLNRLSAKNKSGMFYIYGGSFTSTNNSAVKINAVSDSKGALEIRGGTFASKAGSNDVLGSTIVSCKIYDGAFKSNPSDFAPNVTLNGTWVYNSETGYYLKQ